LTRSMQCQRWQRWSLWTSLGGCSSPFSTVDRPRRRLILTRDVARLGLRRRRGGLRLIAARPPRILRLAGLSLCVGRGNGRNPIILEGFFELVLNIIRVVDELHEHGVIAGATATGQVGIVLPRIVRELHEHVVIAGAAAAGEIRIVLSRIVGELLVIADA